MSVPSLAETRDSASSFLLGLLISCGGFPFSSSPMVTLLRALYVSNTQPQDYDSAHATIALQLHFDFVYPL